MKLPQLKTLLASQLASQVVAARRQRGGSMAARAASRGMTLVEILVVLAIIGLIMGGVAVVAGGAFSDAQVDTARNEVVKIEGLADMYTVKKKLSNCLHQ